MYFSKKKDYLQLIELIFRRFYMPQNISDKKSKICVSLELNFVHYLTKNCTIFNLAYNIICHTV
jgi:hypothetical protein